ncbi:MAG TPA: hypothetical protein VI874_04885, partial [Candidatus Norongarragalinales archaeon]|nr:hypothetical protein [Candidatus Norongarragalinales archaeon]
MGTRLISQRRGKGGPTFTTPSHRFHAPAVYPHPGKTVRGQVLRLISNPAHSAVLAEVLLEDGKV